MATTFEHSVRIQNPNFGTSKLEVTTNRPTVGAKFPVEKLSKKPMLG